MVNAPLPRHACVRFADPAAAAGVEVSADEFLDQCRESALDRFRTGHDAFLVCRTVEHPVPPKPGDVGSTGLIVAHVSPSLVIAWQASAPGSLAQKRAHVEAGLHLALKDLADQDMHGYLAITDDQCAVYDPDLAQLVEEALDRTTFSRLGRRPDPHWEGTLVQRVQPPYLLLVVSIGLAKPASGAGAKGAVPRKGRAAPKRAGTPPRPANAKKAPPSGRGRAEP